MSRCRPSLRGARGIDTAFISMAGSMAARVSAVPALMVMRATCHEWRYASIGGSPAATSTTSARRGSMTSDSRRSRRSIPVVSIPCAREANTPLHPRIQDGIGLQRRHQGLDTTSPTGKLAFPIVAALAAGARHLMQERRPAGRCAAKARGRGAGRPQALAAGWATRSATTAHRAGQPHAAGPLQADPRCRRAAGAVRLIASGCGVDRRALLAGWTTGPEGTSAWKGSPNHSWWRCVRCALCDDILCDSRCSVPVGARSQRRWPS
jgi:hypothetical protein